MGRLREGMPVKLTIGALQDVALHTPYWSTSRRKAAEENGVIMFEIKASTQIPADRVHPGGIQRERGDRDRPAGRRAVDARRAPSSSRATKTFVNLLTSDSTATDQTFERKEVKLGLSNGVNVEVTEGLSGGEKTARHEDSLP